MYKFYTALRDVQQDMPIANCRCKAEIYRYDSVASIGGVLVHESCMTTEELENYSTHPAGSFFEEAC